MIEPQPHCLERIELCVDLTFELAAHGGAKKDLRAHARHIGAEEAIAADEIGNRVRRQHRATFDQHQMQAHAQIRHPLGALGRIERGWRAHHQACGRQDAIAVGDFHRFVDFACRAEIIGGDDEFLQAACSRRSLRNWKNSTPSRSLRFIMSVERSISPTMEAILPGRK